jgi:chaperone BCS1
LIQALAGYASRSISFLQPTHPKFTDDSLKEAINHLPQNTIVVFEDIDSLFGTDRSNKVKGSSLTFSGLLNALDGVGSSSGQIFILTTNLREQLDPALIRCGRVDMHVEFSYVVSEQMVTMWDSFYPEAKALGPKFAAGVTALLGENKLAAAGLQHFFVRNMRSSGEEALANIGWIIEDLAEKEGDKEVVVEKEEVVADKVGVPVKVKSTEKSLGFRRKLHSYPRPQNLQCLRCDCHTYY